MFADAEERNAEIVRAMIYP